MATTSAPTIENENQGQNEDKKLRHYCKTTLETEEVEETAEQPIVTANTCTPTAKNENQNVDERHFNNNNTLLPSELISQNSGNIYSMVFSEMKPTKLRKNCRKHFFYIIIFSLTAVIAFLAPFFAVYFKKPSRVHLGDNDTEGTQYEDLFNTFESAILSRKSNMLRLQRAFFNAPNVDPVFLKIVYTLSFSENFTELTSGYCGEDYDGSSVEEYTFLDINSANKTVLTYGWSSTGIYAAIHPSLLNWMQLQLPLAVLRIARNAISGLIVGEDSPVTDMFLWDTSYDLPTVYLHLNIEYLPCLPSNDLLDELFQDITTLVKLYASGDSRKTTDKIGFALDERSTCTSSRDVLTYGIGGYVIACNFFLPIILSISYSVVIRTFNKDNFITDSTPEWQVIIINLIRNNINILIFTVFIEVIIQFGWSIVWSMNTDSGFIALIWVIFYIFKFSPLFVIPSIMTDKHNYNLVAFFISYVSSYHVLPTFLFLLVFPVQVIAVYLYFIAYYVALFIILKHIVERDSENQGLTCCRIRFIRRGLTHVNNFITVTVVSIFMVLILYIVAVGKTSVITASFSGFLPLLPTVVIAGLPLFLSKTQKANHSSTDDVDKKDVADEHTEQSGSNARISCTNASSTESEV